LGGLDQDTVFSSFGGFGQTSLTAREVKKPPEIDFSMSNFNKKKDPRHTPNITKYPQISLPSNGSISERIAKIS
jgi:hypothetical protein